MATGLSLPPACGGFCRGALLRLLRRLLLSGSLPGGPVLRRLLCGLLLSGLCGSPLLGLLRRLLLSGLRRGTLLGLLRGQL